MIKNQIHYFLYKSSFIFVFNTILFCIQLIVRRLQGDSHSTFTLLRSKFPHGD